MPQGTPDPGFIAALWTTHGPAVAIAVVALIGVVGLLILVVKHLLACESKHDAVGEAIDKLAKAIDAQAEKRDKIYKRIDTVTEKWDAELKLQQNSHREVAETVARMEGYLEAKKEND